MALIKCKHCKKEISPNAKTCIHCGEPVEKVEVKGVEPVEAVVLKDDGTEKCIKLLKRAAIIVLILLLVDTSIDFFIRTLQAFDYAIYSFEDFMNAMVNIVQNTVVSLANAIFYPSVLYGLSHILNLLDRKNK